MYIIKGRQESSKKWYISKKFEKHAYAHSKQ